MEVDLMGRRVQRFFLGGKRGHRFFLGGVG